MAKKGCFLAFLAKFEPNYLENGTKRQKREYIFEKYVFLRTVMKIEVMSYFRLFLAKNGFKGPPYGHNFRKMSKMSKKIFFENFPNSKK